MSEVEIMGLRQRLMDIHVSVPAVLSRPVVQAFFPGAALIGYWVGGETLLVAVSLLLPVLFMLSHIMGHAPHMSARDDPFEQALATTLRAARKGFRRTACILVEVDDHQTLLDRIGHRGADALHQTVLQRIKAVLRDDDQVMHLSDGKFGIAISPVKTLDSEVCTNIANRLQQCMTTPFSIDAGQFYVTVSIGFCVSARLGQSSAREVVNDAAQALVDARRHMPSAVRAYSPALADVIEADGPQDLDVVHALQAGEICAWFQPQISTDTGHVSGFEALARWLHPEKGVISPAEFLPPLRNMGQMGLLGQKILRDSLKALQTWDRKGHAIERIGVNFSPEELRDPKLFDRVAWELDRFDIAPHRLTVEVLETVIAYTPDDLVTRNVRRLSDIGCRVDLDDFGTGYASISSIRRFGIHRLKIDRSFVRNVDRDREQQKLVNAIQMMADQLDLETIAEGVETTGEHALLAQLGCGHVQGFGIAKPMAFRDTLSWLDAHTDRLKMPPGIGHSAR
ncbi:MAG: GGDEF domain-containing phosphodiesterase [Pseudomonadota bacterium]